jgi:hypothetical protein
MGKKQANTDDLAHDQAMRDAAEITRLEKENAQLREVLKYADQATQALAALLNLTALNELRIGNWYVYRTCNGTADAIYKPELEDCEPDGRIKSVAYALRHQATDEYNHVINRATKARYR